MPVSPSLHRSPAAQTPCGRAEVAVAMGLAGFGALCLWIALQGDHALIAWLTSEHGPVERASAVGWAVLAGAVITRQGARRHALSLAAVCLFFAARELDLHMLAVLGDTSFLKTAFYRDPALAPGQKATGALLAFLVLATVTGALAGNGRLFLRRRSYRQPWGRLVLAALALLLLAKCLDRLPAVMAVDWHRPLSDFPRHLLHLLEEGLELFVPTLLIATVAAWPSSSGDNADSLESTARRDHRARP